MHLLVDSLCRTQCPLHIQGYLSIDYTYTIPSHTFPVSFSRELPCPRTDSHMARFLNTHMYHHVVRLNKKGQTYPVPSFENHHHTSRHRSGRSAQDLHACMDSPVCTRCLHMEQGRVVVRPKGQMHSGLR